MIHFFYFMFGCFIFYGFFLIFMNFLFRKKIFFLTKEIKEKGYKIKFADVYYTFNYAKSGKINLENIPQKDEMLLALGGDEKSIFLDTLVFMSGYNSDSLWFDPSPTPCKTNATSDQNVACQDREG